MNDETEFEAMVKPEAHGFQTVLTRINVPVDANYPNGIGCVLSIYTVIGGPLVFIMPPAAMRSQGQQWIEEANAADGISSLTVADMEDLRKLTSGE